MRGRRVATASIYFDFDMGYWRLEQCKGPMNREVCEDLPGRGNGLGAQGHNAEPTDLYFLASETVRRYQHAQDKRERESK